jgi:hypothetical protein
MPLTHPDTALGTKRTSLSDTAFGYQLLTMEGKLPSHFGFYMRVLMRIGILPLALSLCASAATLEKLTLDEMVQKSTAIVRGQVLSSSAAAHGSLIYTHYRIQVTERWKGAEAGVMDVVVPGGTANGMRQNFAGAPSLARGGEYVLFLWTGPSGLTHVVGLTQGLFSVRRDPKGDAVAWRGATGEPMLDGSGRLVKDAPMLFRLGELSGRVARSQGGGR